MFEQVRISDLYVIVIYSENQPEVLIQQHLIGTKIFTCTPTHCNNDRKSHGMQTRKGHYSLYQS